MKEMLEKKLAENHFTSEYDSEKNTLRFVNPNNGAGVTLELNAFQSRFEANQSQVIDEIVYYVEESLSFSGEEMLVGNEKAIFPVIRSTSFPKENRAGKRFVISEHTTETAIFYALDLGNRYKLIDEELLQLSELSQEKLHQLALSNLRSIIFRDKKDTVSGNDFYFISTNDGYDASRILITKYLDKIKTTMQGIMAVAIPHQDVLIIADIKNEQGYDILAHLSMKFFTEGNVPITSLSFLYENGELEPIFILAKTSAAEQNKKPSS